MARDRKVEAGAINIRIHPHPDYHYYVDLLDHVYQLRNIVAGRGDQKLILSSLTKAKTENDSTVMRGTIARFTHIDMDQKWFNMTTNDVAEEGDISRIKIPEYLKPNFQPFSFVFFPKKHILVFEKKSQESTISHGVVESFFRKLFKDFSVLERFGEVNVDIIKDENALREILGIFQLKRLHIMIKRPNPDTLGSLDERVQNRLNRQKANRLEQELVAITGQSLEPDNETQDLAKVAVNNGVVYGKGKDDNGQSVEISTKQYPKTLQQYYDPDSSSHRAAFNDLARDFIGGA